MTTYYHVADPSYEPGMDLLCWDRLAGTICESEMPDWKWDDPPGSIDADIVCMVDTIDEARIFRTDWCDSTYKILALDITDECEIITNGEGLLAVYNCVPWYCITVIDDVVC